MPAPSGSPDAQAAGRGSASSPAFQRDAGCPPSTDMRDLRQANKPPSARWDGHTAKPFLEKFSRQCLARWLAEASGRGDFLEYHVRLNHPPEAVRECPCGRAVPRGHFFSWPLTTFNNSLAGRLDPRAFWPFFQLFRSRASQIEL